jgi:hypothetical protein
MRKPSVPTPVASQASGRLTEKRLRRLEASQQPPAPPPPKAASGPAPIPESCSEPSSSSELDSSCSEEPPRAKKAQSGSKSQQRSSSLSWKEIKSVCIAIPLLQNLGSLVSTLNNAVSRLDPNDQGSDHQRPSSQFSRSSCASSVTESLASIAKVRQPVVPPLPQSQAVVVPPITITGTDPSPTTDVTKRWPWVDKIHIKQIIDGEFDIDNLPKLFRDEQSRRKHSTQTVTGMLFPFAGGSAEIISGTTKLQNVFHSLPTFLSAFLVYVSIRATYAPEYGTTIPIWIERLCGYTVKGSWPPVLAYAIEYFQTHQSAPAEKWLETDGELTSLHFAFAQQPQASSSRLASPKKSTGNNVDLSQYRCKNFNRPGGCKYSQFHQGSTCPRQHVCYNCGDAAHISPSCPTNSGPPPPHPSHIK